MKSVSEESNYERGTLNLPVETTRSGGPIVLSHGSPSLEGEIVQSINSVNACGNHLLDMIGNLNKADASEVMTACEVAKQVVNLARAKVDLIKTYDGIKK
jgi:hypothetical protein